MKTFERSFGAWLLAAAEPHQLLTQARHLSRVVDGLVLANGGDMRQFQVFRAHLLFELGDGGGLRGQLTRHFLDAEVRHVQLSAQHIGAHG